MTNIKYQISNKPLNIALIAFMLLFAVSLSAGAETIEVAPLITDIELRGNFAIPDQVIEQAVFSRVGENLSQAKVRTDLKSIYSLGYFKDVEVSFKNYLDGTKIIYLCQENPLVEGISIEGNTAISSLEILAAISSKPKQILNFKFLQEDIKAINELYAKSGYVLAHIIDASLDEKTNFLNIKIMEGRVEAIVLKGNELTQNYVILRELKTKANDVFNEKNLAKDLRRVYNLGFFSEVLPNINPGSTPDQVILIINVKESRSNTINFGGGYGEREGWFGFVDLSVNNLFGTARGLLVRAQTGQEVQTYQFKYTDPWLYPEYLGDRTSFAFKRWYTIGRDLFIYTQQELRNGGEISFGKSLTDEIKTSLSLGTERVTPYADATFEGYDSQSIGLSTSYDTRDFWLNPSEGELYTLSLKQGWKQASGNTTFFKLGLDLNQYTSLQKNHVLAIHLGSGIGTGDIPISELYWSGGANTVRGYTPTETRTGVRKLIGNIEYRLNFNEMFQGVFFYDFGDAWNAGGIVSPRFMTGWGPGIRLNTPMGPIRLDYGVSTGKTFSEGIMHFSIGQAF